MIVSCPQCGVKYRFERETLEGESKKVKCAKCEHVFTIQAPEVEDTLMGSKDGKSKADGDTTQVVKSDDIITANGDGTSFDGMRLSLAILSGPLAGQVFQIQKKVTLIGRAQGDIITSDPEVSRKHCHVEVRPDGVYLTDLGSTNGTFLDGKAILDARLEDKSEFVVGSTSIMLIISGD